MDLEVKQGYSYRQLREYFNKHRKTLETKPMKQLKPITLRALLEARPAVVCGDFDRAIGHIVREGYVRSGGSGINNYGYDLGYVYLKEIFGDFPAGRQFLIDNGFIAEEKTYAVGQWFELGESKSKYTLIVLPTKEACLINALNGGFWDAPIIVANRTHLEENEMQRLVGLSWWSTLKPIPNPLAQQPTPGMASMPRNLGQAINDLQESADERVVSFKGE